MFCFLPLDLSLRRILNRKYAWISNDFCEKVGSNIRNQSRRGGTANALSAARFTPTSWGEGEASLSENPSAKRTMKMAARVNVACRRQVQNCGNSWPGIEQEGFVGIALML